MLRRSGEALLRDRDRGRSKPSVTPGEGDEEPVLTPKEQFENDIQNGGTVTVAGDLSFSSAIPITHDTVIDLNGHTIEAALSSALFEVNGAKLTLRGDGTVQNNVWIADVSNGGRVTVDSGTYVNRKEGFRAYGEGSTIIFNGGTLRTVECGLSAQAGAIVEMNGGLIETSDNMGISTNGRSGLGGNTITMNGGKIDASITSSGYEAIGIYIANDDVFVMNDGEVIANGGTGLCMRAGDVTIHGGKITATGVSKAGVPVADGKIADAPAVMTGVSGVIYHETANYPAKAGMKLTIDGGVITGVDHAVEVLSNEEEPQVFVTGGTFVPPYPEAESEG